MMRNNVSVPELSSDKELLSNRTFAHSGGWEAVSRCGASVDLRHCLGLLDIPRPTKEEIAKLDHVLPLSPATVVVSAAGVPVPVQMSAHYRDRVIVPLAQHLQMLLRSKGKRRILVGICGAAGAGKTVIAALLSWALSALGTETLALSMDGYHYYNKVLDARGLRPSKGRPQTIDVDSFSMSLGDLLAAEECDRPLALPEYDRKLHDPVPDRLLVPSSAQIIIVEGLHLLQTTGGWQDIRPLLQACLLLRAKGGLDMLRDRVVARKVACGSSATAASRHFDRTDAATWHEIEKQAAEGMADLVLTFDKGSAAGLGGRCQCPVLVEARSGSGGVQKVWGATASNGPHGGKAAASAGEQRK